jgi:hypothetical protein
MESVSRLLASRRSAKLLIVQRSYRNSTGARKFGIDQYMPAATGPSERFYFLALAEQADSAAAAWLHLIPLQRQYDGRQQCISAVTNDRAYASSVPRFSMP